jgi:aminopeptidase N
MDRKIKFNKIRQLSVLGLFLLTIFSTFTLAQQLRTRTYDVQHYIIRTKFDRPEKMVIGDTTVQLKPLADGFNTFFLDAVGFKVESVTLEPDNIKLEWSASPDKINIKLDKTYTPQDLISVRVKYRVSGTKSNSNAGIYFVDEVRENGRVVRPSHIWTQGEPEQNSLWYPCFDALDDKATSEQFITIPSNETAIANGELVDTVDNGDGTKTVHYKMSIPYANYLTSLVVGNYVKVEDKYKNISIGYYMYPGTENIAKNAYGKTPYMMETYEKLLKFDFPYNKYDQTIVSSFGFGGMENITATTMDDNSILAAADINRIDETEDLVLHELAHSWFGNMVTTKNWSNLWLNEGFATYMEAAFHEVEKGRPAYMAIIRRNTMTAMGEELYKKHPILWKEAKARLGVGVTNISLFDATTYQRGSVVIHQLREFVGDDVFWKALNLYLTRHKFQSVETKDLQKAFEDASGQNLDWFFEQWVSKAGHPQLSVRQDYNNATKTLTLTVSQTQKPDSTTPAVFRLPVEVEFSLPKGEKQVEKIDINQREQKFTFKVPVKPTKVTFDKREQIMLKKVEFSQTKSTGKAKGKTA